MTLEQLRDFNRMARLLTGRGSVQGTPILGCYSFGVTYCAERVPESVRLALRMAWTSAVLAAMESGEEVRLAEISRPILDRLMESVLDNHEVHGRQRSQAKDFLRTLTFIGHPIKPRID